MNVVDVVEKLMQLALRNPNAEEAAAAAMKAVRLLDSHQIPIGANIRIVRDIPTYTPPTPEEEQTIADLLNKKQGDPERARRAYTTDHHEGKTEGLLAQDHTPQTGQDAFRQRLIDAWRALREERIRLQSEIHRYEVETRRKFKGDSSSW